MYLIKPTSKQYFYHDISYGTYHKHQKAIDHLCYCSFLSLKCLLFPISKVIVMSVSAAAAAAGYFIFMPISLKEGEWSAVPLALLPHLVVSELWGSRFIAQVETAGEQHR